MEILASAAAKRAAKLCLVTVMTYAAPTLAYAQCTTGRPAPVTQAWKATRTKSNGADITIYTGPTDYGAQLQLTAGPDKSLWVAMTADASIMKFSLKGKAALYATPHTSSAPEAIAYNGKDVWFTEWTTPCAGSITGSGAIHEYALPDGVTETMSTSMTPGLNGYTWFGTDSHGIGSISPKGKIVLYAVADESTQLTGVTLGPDGNVWFVEISGTNIGKITPTGTVTEYNVNMPNGSQGFGITAGPDGRIWWVDAADKKIGAINTDGTGLTYYSKGLTGTPLTIVGGPDGFLYIGEDEALIGKLTTKGVTTEYPVPVTEGSFPVINVTVGPDKNIWFTNNAHSQLGKVQLPIK